VGGVDGTGIVLLLREQTNWRSCGVSSGSPIRCFGASGPFSAPFAAGSGSGVGAGSVTGAGTAAPGRLVLSLLVSW
jgi:hypothetical protein